MELYADIHKNYGGFQLDVQFEAADPVTGLLGASGSGKSLTLRCIAGIERPDRGCIRLDGRTLFDSAARIDLPPQQRQVGYLFQNYALFPHMTVRENILCGLHRVRDKAARAAAVEEMVRLLGLEGLEHLRPGQLSGGQAQRTALARILVTQPKLLLLDEPFSALDSHLRDQLQPQMKGLLDRFGQQALLVTHSRDEAYRLCSQLRVLEAGRVIRAGSVSEVFRDPGSAAAARITGCKNIAPARRAGEYRAEVPVWGVTLTTAQPVPEDLAAVGLRAHAFRAGAGANAFPVEFRQTMEEPFEWSLLFRFAGQALGAEDLWWRMSKGDRPEVLPGMLTVAPEEVLLFV